MSIIVPIVVFAIICVQILFFVLNLYRMYEFKDVFKFESSWRIDKNEETGFVCGIEGSGNRIFSSIKLSINKYLSNNSGSVIDFHLLKAGFQSDDQLIMFPAGLCSRRQNGVIRDLEWKKTFVVKSIQAKRDVIPVHFGGRNSDFFYNLANICKALGIKFNIAMLYLADEMFKNRHKTFTVTFGKPIPWQTFDKSKTPAQWAEYVKDIVYKL